MPPSDLPWLPQTRIQTRNPLISNSAVLRTIRDQKSNLKRILTLFASAARQPSFRHSYQIYQTLIPLLANLRQFRLADVILSIMRRRDGLMPGASVLLPLIAARAADGCHDGAADVFLRFPTSNKVFSFLFRALIVDGEVDLAEKVIGKASELGFQVQVRYYNALIKEFCDRLRIGDGMRVFKTMMHSGVPLDVITFSTLINCLGKDGRLLELNVLFGKMLVMGVSPDIAWFNILFRVYLRNQMVVDAVRVLRAMKSEGFLHDDDVSEIDGEVGKGTLGQALKRGFIG